MEAAERSSHFHFNAQEATIGLMNDSFAGGFIQQEDAQKVTIT